MSDFLYICDDFGLCPSVDQAIIELSQKNKITGTSILVNSLERLSQSDTKALSCQKGLHVNLTEGPMMTESFSELTQEAWSLQTLIFKTLTGQLKRKVLVDEIKKQMQVFQEKVGGVDYIDGHQHIQYFPPICQALLEAKESLGLKSIRVRMGAFHSYQGSFFKKKILNSLCRQNRFLFSETAFQYPYELFDFALFKKKNHFVHPTEFMLHVAHPEIPAPQLDQTSYSYNDRVNQFLACLDR